AGPVLLAGPGVRAGLVGEAPSLLDLQDGDLKMLVDFRRVYATILEQWLALPAKAALGGGLGPPPLFPRRAGGARKDPARRGGLPGRGGASPPASSTAPGLATACCDPCRRAECAARTRRVVGRVRDKRSREGGPPDHLPGGPAGAGAAAAAPTAAAGLLRPRA